VIGQIGALSGRSTASWHGRPFGVVQVARFSVAARSCVNVSLARFAGHQTLIRMVTET
jgi:hypothetical protein